MTEPSKKRVLFVLPDARGGGSEKIAILLLKYWNRKSWDIHVTMIEPTGPFLSQIPADISVHDLKSRRARGAFLPLLKLARHLKPDVIFAPLAYVNVTILALKPFLRNTKFWIREANDPNLSHGFVMKLFCRYFYPKADGVICQSETLLQQVQSSCGVAPEKIRIIPNPVDEEAIRAAVQGPSPYPDDGNLRLVAAGRLARQKGFDVLLRAVRLLKDRGLEVYVNILGEGPEEKTLKNLADDLKIGDHVDFVGFRENPYPYFKHADVFVLSSRWEGMPNVVLEALACGIPVVATDVGALSEMARDIPTLNLVAVENVESFTEILGQVLANQKKYSVGALPERYQVRNAVRAYEQVLGEQA